jgi:hypothetical protein
MLSVTRLSLALTIGALASTIAFAGAPAVTIQFDNQGAEQGVTVPGTVSFAYAGSIWKGGVVQEVADEALASSSKTAWRVVGVSEVRFPAPVSDVRFFFVHDDGQAPAKAYAFDANGQAIGSIESHKKTAPGDPANFAELGSGRPIARIVLGGGYVDDFSYVSLLEACSSTARLCASRGVAGTTLASLNAGGEHGGQAYVIVVSRERDGAAPVLERFSGVLDASGTATAVLPIDAGAFDVGARVTLRALVRTERGFTRLDEALRL